MIVAIDIETRDSNGANFEYFRKDFKIFSLSCAWRNAKGEIEQWFSTTQGKIHDKLFELHRNQHKIVAHNLSFERGCIEALYPRLNLNWHADTMRMAQLRDNGGDEFAVPEFTTDQLIDVELGDKTEEDITKEFYKRFGLSLEACALRFLDSSDHNHKSAAHEWLHKTYNIKRKHGQFLHLLPYNLLQQYNNADTYITLLLYETNLAFFDTVNFDWHQDNQLYMLRAKLMSKAFYEGISINRPKLLEYILDMEKEIRDIEDEFMNMIAPLLPKLQTLRYQQFITKRHSQLKSDKGKLKNFENVMAGKYDDKWKILNIGSSQQLALLFQNIIGIEPNFLTKKGAPSFRTTHLHQWGKEGIVLRARRRRLLVLQQAISTYLGSEYDNRIHCSIKVSGTRTNRVAGGRI